jgi:hypothetical protein
MTTPAHDTPRGASKKGWTRPDRIPLYRLAYEESQRALDDQAVELDGLRQRVTQFLAFVGTATAFLVGAGISSSQRDAIFYALAACGTLASLGTITMAGSLLLLLRLSWRGPRLHQWELRLSGKVLVNWIEPELGGPDEADFLRAVTLRQANMWEANEKQLSLVRRYYVLAVVLGFAQVMVWATLAWARG